MNTYQIETTTVIGSISSSGNASVIITARGMLNSPKEILVDVATYAEDIDVAYNIRQALAFDADVSAVFAISGSGADVVLTKHQYAVNDTTLNISIDNGTCLGLTPVLESINTAGGVLDSLYVTVEQFKAYKGGFGTPDTANDDVIADQLLAAQGYIEIRTEQKFKISGDVGYTDRFFTPGRDTDGLKLNFDMVTCGINTITYGFGQTLLADEYITYPRDAPYYAIKIKDNIAKVWQFTQVYENSIIINALWAYSETPPADVKQAVLQIANYLYDKRNQPDSDRQIVTAEGIILPAGLSKVVSDIIEVYKFRV